MGARVNAANHLGELLTLTKPRPATARADYQHLIDEAANWHEAMVHAGTSQHPDPQNHELSDFQADFNAAKNQLLAARQQIKAAAGLL
jgi:hypothetical protein